MIMRLITQVAGAAAASCKLCRCTTHRPGKYMFFYYTSFFVFEEFSGLLIAL